MVDLACYCGSQAPFTACCRPLIFGEAPATGPEALMRSRYSAFCVGAGAYLMQTLPPEKQKQEDPAALADAIRSTKWLSLRILASKTGRTTGEVEFVAFYQAFPKAGQLHERSSFVRLHDRWYYRGGDILPAIKLKRNDPCWCGSGRKLKHCCN